MMYGRDPVLPFSFQEAPTLNINATENWSLDGTIDHLLQTASTLDEVQTKALSNIEQAQQRQKLEFDKRHRTFDPPATPIEVGDFVLVQTAKRSKVHSEAEIGTYRVTRFPTKSNVEVEDAKGTKFIHHLDNIRLHAKKDEVDEEALEDMLE